MYELSGTVKLAVLGILVMISFLAQWREQLQMTADLDEKATSERSDGSRVVVQTRAGRSRITKGHGQWPELVANDLQDEYLEAEAKGTKQWPGCRSRGGGSGGAAVSGGVADVVDGDATKQAFWPEGDKHMKTLFRYGYAVQAEE
ncbi:hypothetical protein B0J11DRAFT_504064 [Dendryphion nanum]|uniref:Uncharacterized protein n=1 Tax=Dendryphion nanum TaxID=256645 RepID=A0A9P9E3W9_9PLEO|nr:hypothetical protein B0J11DRAFT_504064 [Dendryphion nanum]